MKQLEISFLVFLKKVTDGADVTFCSRVFHYYVQTVYCTDCRVYPESYADCAVKELPCCSMFLYPSVTVQLQADHNRSSWRLAVQLLSSLVRRDISHQRVKQHWLPVHGTQADVAVGNRLTEICVVTTGQLWRETLTSVFSLRLIC